jgi:hypothetical protein
MAKHNNRNAELKKTNLQWNYSTYYARTLAAGTLLQYSEVV